MATLSANKMFKLQRGDFSSDPDVLSGDIVGIQNYGSGTIIGSATSTTWVTSLWMVDYGHDS